MPSRRRKYPSVNSLMCVSSPVAANQTQVHGNRGPETPVPIFNSLVGAGPYWAAVTS